MKHSWRVPLLLGLAGAASSYACTFGANDFKIVPRTGSGGSGTEAGSDSGGASANGGANASGGSLAHGGSAGSSAAGSVGMAGEAGAPAGTGGSSGSGASGGNGGSGGGTTMLTCGNQTPKPLVLMSYADLHMIDQIDRFVMVTSPNSVFAIASIALPVTGGGNQTHMLIRAVSDSSSGAVRGIADITMPSHFQFGGAWATATEVNMVGGDNRGIIQVTVPLDNGGSPVTDPTKVTTTVLDTPADCKNNLRDVRIAYSASDGLSFVASCIPDSNNQNAVSLWIYSRATSYVATNIVPGNPNATANNPDIDNIVRGFVRNGTSGNSLIFVGQEVGAQADFRVGGTPQALSSVKQLSLSNDASLFEGIFATGLSDAVGGVFMVGATLHDPSMGSVVPVSIYAGKITADSYASLSAVPPPQLSPVKTYDSAASVEFPADVAIRGTTAFVAASNPLQKQNVYLWALSTSGGPLMADFPVYTGTDTVSDLAIGRFTLNNLVGWEASTAAGTTIYGASVGCF